MKVLRALLIMFLIAGLLGAVYIQVVSATDSEILKELEKLKARIEQLEKGG